MKILLGGIPLGCDNIGDEAIIAGVCAMLKASVPDVALTVCTADPGTGPRLGVETAPLLGFSGSSGRGDAAAFAALARRHDAYVWCGATGLSDYPDAGLGLLAAAQDAGVPAFVWGVGMDDEPNPAFFKAAGRRKAVLDALRLTGRYEALLRRRLSRRIRAVLPRCRGVWVRDAESAAALASFGFPDASVAADSAILFAREGSPARKDAPGRAPLLGMCLSAQRQVSDFSGVRAFVETVRSAGCGILGIPMNPKTDRAPLESLGIACIDGTEPEDVLAAAARCDAVISSRLHLLILAACAGTPGLGISRGSKVANWLANFGEKPVGDVRSCDWDAAATAALRLLCGSSDWASTREAVFAHLRARFEKARGQFVSALLALPRR